MPKANVKKTKLAPKIVLSIFTVLFILLAIVYLLSTKINLSNSNNTKANSCNGIKLTTKCIVLERAESNQQRIKGLSDRNSLGANEGMLFKFDHPDEQCFWMKDMRFNLDIIWINAQKKIVKVENDVSPNSYPRSFCSDDTKYVIEINAGQTKELGLSIGQQLTF